jgi:hypothetical protein
MKTTDEQNDEIRARVNAELPRPAGGFETSEAEEAWRDAQNQRFLELCAESANAERIREAAPELLEALESLLHEDGGSLAYSGGNPVCIAARSAIAKARGGGL